jgi:hypothetical protein
MPDGLQPGGTIPLNVIVRDRDGREVGGIAVFLRGGLLADVDIYTWFESPLPLPEPDMVDLGVELPAGRGTSWPPRATVTGNIARRKGRGIRRWLKSES